MARLFAGDLHVGHDGTISTIGEEVNLVDAFVQSEFGWHHLFGDFARLWALVLGFVKNGSGAIDFEAPAVIWTIPFVVGVFLVTFSGVAFFLGPISGGLGVPGSFDVEMGFGDCFWRIDLINKV